MRLWAGAHAIDDLYQGMVPATIPYFVADRHYSYAVASGLVLAATLGASLPQPFIGLVVDRWSLGWFAALGVAVAGTGAGLSGVMPSYLTTWLAFFLSGLGVAAFHPSAGKGAREASGSRTSDMSLFAAGGTFGFAVAPIVVTPVIIALGLHGTSLFILPAVICGALLMHNHAKVRSAQVIVTGHAGRDQWVPFGVLTGVEILRSVMFFGMNTFIEFYWLKVLHSGRAAAAAALVCFLSGGVAGTMLGGAVADRIGMSRTVKLGTLLSFPAILGLRLCPSYEAAWILAVLSGMAVNVPLAVLVKLGQDYLPNRHGTSSGVTLGLAVSAGGLAAVPLGVLADAHGPGAAIWVVCLTALPAFGLAQLLPPSGPPAHLSVRAAGVPNS
jgi:MFS transporter, FSR family, fosmidomycin resistance protein